MAVKNIWNKFPNHIVYYDKMTGHRPTFGKISIKDLDPYYGKLLITNPHIRWDSKDPDFVKAVFCIENKMTYNKRESKIWIDPNVDEIVDSKKDFKQRLNKERWHCSCCGEEIFSRTDDFTVKNFVCQSCYNSKSHKDEHGNIYKSILDDAMEFMNYCRGRIREDREHFYHDIMKNKKNILKYFDK